MATKRRRSFNTKAFLARVGEGRSIGKYRKGQAVFAQGDPGDAVFYIQKGKAKLTVVSEQGKEAVIAILGTDDFFGEGCLAGQAQRIATVAALTDSVIAVTVAMRCACPARHPSPKKSSVPRIAMTASLPCSETTVSFTLPFWT